MVGETLLAEKAIMLELGEVVGALAVLELPLLLPLERLRA